MENITKNIIKSPHLGIKGKIKNLFLYLSLKRGVRRRWQSRYRRVLNANSVYNRPGDPSVELDHKKMWSVFQKKADITTLRVCHNISGTTDCRIIPEEVFDTDIQPTLIRDERIHFLGHKSFFNRWFSEADFPKDIFHRIDGAYFDSALNQLSLSQLEKRAEAVNLPVVLKPNVDTYGGNGIYFVNDTDQLIKLCRQRNNFVVQEKIEQHHFFERYHPVGLNTVRACVYKSVTDNQHHVLNLTLRMGKGGSLDNETSGGIHVMIREDGMLNGYAVDKDGTKYTEHPDSGLSFDDAIPQFENLNKLAIKVARQVYLARLVSLDLCFDKEGRWRVVEVNTRGHTIRFSQYGGKSFFGEFTGEVIAYCRQNHWALQ